MENLPRDRYLKDISEDRLGKAENLRRDKYQKDIPEDRGENLYTDLSKEREREGKRGKEQEQRSEQQVSEDRWGDGERIT